MAGSRDRLNAGVLHVVTSQDRAAWSSGNGQLGPFLTSYVECCIFSIWRKIDSSPTSLDYQSTLKGRRSEPCIWE